MCILVKSIGGTNMGTSLIPIKGISQSLKNSLKSKCNICDIAELLKNGASTEDRQAIADALKIDRRNVDLWVMQASIWNIKGMTGDYAFLLVAAGIRNSIDLGRISIDATKIVLRSVSTAHPDYQYDESKLAALGAEAEKYSISTTDPIPMFDDHPEPTHLFKGTGIDLFAGQGNMGGISKITVTVTFTNGQVYENTTTFPAIYGGSISAPGGSDSSNDSDPTTGRIDHPAGKGTYTESNTPTRTTGSPGRRR
jgi:hypothetical protein